MRPGSVRRLVNVPDRPTPGQAGHILRAHGGKRMGTRQRVNQDRHHVDQAAGLFAVAVGLGGVPGSEAASEAVVTALSGVAPANGLSARVEDMERALEATNAALYEASRVEGRTNPPGTTVLAVTMTPSFAGCVWVGDSRLYLLREGALYQLSRDHSLAETSRREGDTSAAPAPGSVITRAVGVAEALRWDRISFRLRADDLLLLCTDGILKAVDHGELVEVLASRRCESVDELMRMADARATADDATAVVVEVLAGRAS